MTRGGWLGVLLLALLAAVGAPAHAGALPDDFVALHDIAPSIVEDMRYAGPRNFTGKPLPGYDAPRCLLRRRVAEALARVQTTLAADGLSLKVYDCYRPERAVRAMHDWVRAKAGGGSFHHPALERRDLVSQGYIARRSGHSRGTAVDLTIVRSASTSPPVAAGRTCTDGPDDDSVDMGTAFDCFDPKSATASSKVTSEQGQWRRRLVHEMRRQGFTNYRREWWHFSFGQTSGADESADFAIEAAAPP